MGRYPGGTVVRVTPTLSTDAYAIGDVLFVATKIPGAVSNRGGVSYLQGMYMLDSSDQSSGDNDIRFVFQETEGTAVGTINAAADISSANLVANKVLGTALSIADNATTASRIVNSRVHQVFPAGGVNESSGPNLMLKADSGSTDVYIWAVLEGNTTPTYAADSLEFIFHIEYLD
tara:strand:- start:843 stop:1367 length:525 start_codon:yes stop_codon:yes gene_type:complete